MHIGIFYKQFLGDGGFPREWRRFALELAQLDVEITVFCFSNDKHNIKHHNIKIFPITASKANSFKIPVSLKEYIKDSKHNIDIFEIVACYELLNISFMKLLRSLHMPYVVAPLGHLAPNIVRNHWWKKLPFIYLLLKPCLKHAVAIHTFSVLESSWVNKYSKSPTLEACHGSYIEDIPDTLNHNYLKQLLSLPKNNLIILYLGRLDVKGKGLYELLDGFYKSCLTHDNISLVLIGPDENNNKNKLLKKIDDLNLSNAYILHPMYGDEKFDAIASADIFIYPSRYDILPRSIREALAAGCPTIASTETHFSELLYKYNAGSSCNVTPDSISNEIIKLVSSKNTLLRMRNNAKELCISSLSWKTESKKLKSGLESLLSAFDN